MNVNESAAASTNAVGAAANYQENFIECLRHSPASPSLIPGLTRNLPAKTKVAATDRY